MQRRSPAGCFGELALRGSFLELLEEASVLLLVKREISLVEAPLLTSADLACDQFGDV
jgi:phage head maturation protease